MERSYLRIKTKVDFIGGTWFSFFWRSNETGMQFGVRWKGRDVHLTVYQREGIIDAHIKDNGREVWRESMTMEEIDELVAKMEKKCIRHWKRHEKIIPISEEELQTFGNINQFADENQTLDMGRLIIDTATILSQIFHRKKTRISEIMEERGVFGLQKRLTGWHWVIALPDGSSVRWPLDVSRTPLGKIPIDRGFRKYMKYIEKAGFFEDFQLAIEQDQIDAYVSELELAILENLEGHQDS